MNTSISIKYQFAIIMFFLIIFKSGPADDSIKKKQEVKFILSSADAGDLESYAAREFRRYFYLRTTQLLPIEKNLPSESGGVILAGKNNPLLSNLKLNEDLTSTILSLRSEEFIIKTVHTKTGTHTLVVGGSESGTLYGTYRLLEHLGVRFYLHGDVIPDKRIPPDISIIDEMGSPRFDLRGIVPFHDFPEGPDWWEIDDYKAILTQMPKLGFNFIGLHNYQEGPAGPELNVWYGSPEDVLPDGHVKFSYPGTHFNTMVDKWNYEPTRTSQYLFGAADLFEMDVYSSELMKGNTPWPKDQKAANELFYKAGQLYNEVFNYCHRLGIKTCLGTELPLRVPKVVQRELALEGIKDEYKLNDIVLRGIFKRIAATHPLDYFWFWTPEKWAWHDAEDEDVKAVYTDFIQALNTIQSMDYPFKIVMSGWVLGVPGSGDSLNEKIPPNIPISSINRNMGHDEIEKGYFQINDRPLWSITWLEDDGAMVVPQLWAGRVMKDAADAKAAGCEGFMGLHWRTNIIGPNVSALSISAWNENNFADEHLHKIYEEGPVGGFPGRYYDNPITDSNDDLIYQSMWFDLDSYNVALKPGIYSVTLHFCETEHDNEGERIFQVSLPGKPPVQIDLASIVGLNRAYNITFDDVKVSTNILSIDFKAIENITTLSAIELDGPTKRKINCSGSTWNDFESDVWPPMEYQWAKRNLPTTKFYNDWANAQFGQKASADIAAVFAGLDGRMPQPAGWTDGPGGIVPDTRPWEMVKRIEYGFVDDLEKFRESVKGAGNLERYDFWLNQFRYMRALAEMKCTWGELDSILKPLVKMSNVKKRREIATNNALPVFRKLIPQVEQAHRYLLASVSTTGGMGNIATWQQRVIPDVLYDTSNVIESFMGTNLPDDLIFSSEYKGPARLIVPTVRTSLGKDETLNLKAIIIGTKVKSANLFWRPLGGKTFKKEPLKHINHGVYNVKIKPVENIDFEYYMEVITEKYTSLKFPATAPAINQTIVYF